MKKILFILAITVAFISCTQEPVVLNNTKTSPVLIKVEAIHSTGEVITTPIVTVR